jgi:hypothetical protein
MRTSKWGVVALAFGLLTGMAVWAQVVPLQARAKRATLIIEGQPGGRVKVTLDIPGKELVQARVKSTPDGRLLLTKQVITSVPNDHISETDKAVEGKLTLFLDDLADSAETNEPSITNPLRTPQTTPRPAAGKRGLPNLK